MFQNYPDRAPGAQGWYQADLVPQQIVERGGYPLGVAVRPAAEMVLMMRYHRAVYDDPSVSALAGRFQAVLLRLADGQCRIVDEVSRPRSAGTDRP